MSATEIAGRYRLDKEIGRGGMGAVWRAFDLRLQRFVALKHMSAEQLPRPSARQRFQQEALAIAQLKSPHVVQIHDYGVDEDVPFLVMELLEGEDLNARLSRLGRLPLPVIVSLVAQIAKALDEAHAAGIVHRDLKPDNVFLARSEKGEESVKVLDFGLAALAASLAVEAAGRTALLGTPFYMSPEQVRGSSNVDHRSDLWALGVLAYRALTGKTPFGSSVLGDLFVSVCVDTPEPPSVTTPGLAAGVDAFFVKALAKDPLRRFQSAGELAAALATALDPSPRPSKLLVVDDEPDMVALLKLRFRQQIRSSIYELVFAADGEEALEALRQHPDIDVTLTDIRMPKMDGLTFLARARELRSDLPILVVSAFGDMTNLRTAMNRGAFDFLVKPIDFQDLDATIQKALNHARELRAAARSAEQNAALRMFASGRVSARLHLPLAGIDKLPDEVVDGAVACLRISGFDGAIDVAPASRPVRYLNAILELIVPEIVARGGEIEKIVGSTVIALFQGEGSELCAVAAATSVREQLARLAVNAGGDAAFSFGIGAGIAAGKTLRACVGSRTFARLDDALLGAPPAIAAHLALRAAPGEILVPDAVKQATEETFAFRAHARMLPGEIEAPPLWNVAGKRTSTQPSSAPTTVAVQHSDSEELTDRDGVGGFERTGAAGSELSLASRSGRP